MCFWVRWLTHVERMEQKIMLTTGLHENIRGIRGKVAVGCRQGLRIAEIRGWKE